MKSNLSISAVELVEELQRPRRDHPVMPGELLLNYIQREFGLPALLEALEAGLVRQGGYPSFPPLKVLWRRRADYIARLRFILKNPSLAPWSDLGAWPHPACVVMLTRKGWRYKPSTRIVVHAEEKDLKTTGSQREEVISARHAAAQQRLKSIGRRNRPPSI